jgi:cytochrome c biogenesis protein CcdA
MAMGIWGWVVLLIGAAAIATMGQLLFFARDRRPNDHDWVYLAGGALLGGFTAHVWYPDLGPALDGLMLGPALVGALVGAVVAEAVYRMLLRPRQA